MPFGRAGDGEFGTYFIGYSRSPRTIEQMIENMFIGRPAGNYDRLLDFSRAVTGNLFFVPSATFLETVGEDQSAASSPSAAPTVVEPSPSQPRENDGSLGIGSLKGESSHE
jgi:putative iron-dependent peroxidase